MGEGQNIIACFYDCDQTLTPEYMQNPMLRHFGVDPAEFWKDDHASKTEAKAAGVDINPENAYMISLLRYIEEKKLPPLSNDDLKKYGKLLTAYPGLPKFFLRTKNQVEERYGKHGLKLEHYIISTGLRKMIEGSCLNAPGALDQIFASEFVEYRGVIRWPARNVGFIEKTKYLYEANKGVNVNPAIDVNKRMSLEKRRIQFQNMIYVGDGFTDVPCMALTLERGGMSIGVYDSQRSHAHREVQDLLQDGRISRMALADYRKGGEASEAIEQSIMHAAERILRNR